MNIQIFGKSKCFDTKKAERYFKERRIKYQYIDLLKYGMSFAHRWFETASRQRLGTARKAGKTGPEKQGCTWWHGIWCILGFLFNVFSM